MFKYFKRFLTEERTGSPATEDWLKGRQVELGELFERSDNVTAEQSLTESTVMACIRILAESESVLPLDLKQNENGKITKVKQHNAAYLIGVQPNAVQNPFEFRENMVKDIALNGNFYGIYTKDRYGNPLEICPENNDNLRPFAYDHTSSTYTRYFPGAQIAYNYNCPEKGGKVLLKNDLLHVKGMSLDGLQGLSPIGVQRETIGLALMSKRHGRAFLQNGARPSGVVSHPNKISPTAIENIAEPFNLLHSNYTKVGKTVVLGEGATYTPMQINHRDAQYLESRQFSKLEICAMYRIPPHMAADLSRATFSNIEHLSLEFVVFTLGPWLTRIETALNTSLLTRQDRERGLFFDHNVKSLLKGDNAARSSYYQSGITAGWLTRNEAREMEGLNQIEGADELLAPLNMAPAGTDTIKGDAGEE